MKLTLVAFTAALLAATAAGAQDRRAVELHAQGQGGKVAAVAPVRVPLYLQTVKGAPYSAEIVTEHVQVLADGNRIMRRTTGRIYRDSQGRTRREEDIEPGKVGSIWIVDPVANISYTLDARTKTAWKTGAHVSGAIAGKVTALPHKTSDPAERERQRAVVEEIAAATGHHGMPVMPTLAPGAGGGANEKRETLPARAIEGVMAQGTRVTFTIPAGAIGNDQPIVSTVEEWRSPELQVLVMTRTSDPRTGETTYRLTSVVRAEPNASWFELPSEYTVRETGMKRLAPVMK